MVTAIDPDFLLIQKMRMGDDKAIETFVKKYYPSILKYCQTHVNDRSYTEDLTQDTFARFFQSFDQYRHFGKAANYLYTIASHVCQDYYKQLKEIPFAALPDTKEQHTTSPEQEITAKLALSSLPPELKETTILLPVLYHKYTHQEIQ